MPSLITKGSIECLNGNAKVGDIVAYATKWGNSAEMVMGEIIGFEERHPGYWDHRETVLRVKIRVIKRSGSITSASITGVEKTDRMVIIEPEVGEAS